MKELGKNAVSEENISEKSDGLLKMMGFGVFFFFFLYIGIAKTSGWAGCFGTLWDQIFSYRSIEWFWKWVIRIHKVGMSLFLSFSLFLSLSLYLWSMQTDTCTKPTENTSRGCWENSSTLVYNAFFFSSSPSLFRSASAAVLVYSRLPCLHFHSQVIYLFYNFHCDFFWACWSVYDLYI